MVSPSDLYVLTYVLTLHKVHSLTLWVASLRTPSVDVPRSDLSSGNDMDCAVFSF